MKRENGFAYRRRRRKLTQMTAAPESSRLRHLVACVPDRSLARRTVAAHYQIRPVARPVQVGSSWLLGPKPVASQRLSSSSLRVPPREFSNRPRFSLVRRRRGNRLKHPCETPARPELRLVRLMKTEARTAFALFGGGAMLVMAVACGGGDNKGPSSSSTTPSSSTTQTTVSSTVPSSGAATSETQPGGAPGPSGTGGPGGGGGTVPGGPTGGGGPGGGGGTIPGVGGGGGGPGGGGGCIGNVCGSIP